jgi:hypothetical protein
MSDERDDAAIIIVSGLPRSGTSMMMKMLEAGGAPPLTDNLRAADADNPRGYYEFERVKQLPKGDVDWLAGARGKAVKVIAALLTYLPATYPYRIIFMRRAMPEILASQRQMLIRRGEDPDKFSDEELARLFEKHLERINAWIERQPNITRIEVNYNAMLEDPATHLARIDQFLDHTLDLEKMQQVIDHRLHRQRAED